MTKKLIAASLFLAPAAAGASTDAAWKALHDQATRRCIQASQLKAAKASMPIMFSDANGQVAVLVRGTFTQPAMKGATGTMLCLYDKRRKVAEVQEANGWRASR
jgi:hypothetical protein